MTPKLLLAAIVAIIIIVIAGFLVLSPSSTPQEEVHVVMADGAWERFPEQEYFRPSEIVVILGVNNTVTWNNEDQSGRALHDVVSDTNAFNSGLLGPGESWTFVFEDVGDYPYHCDPHPWMEGKVIVKGE